MAIGHCCVSRKFNERQCTAKICLFVSKEVDRQRSDLIILQNLIRKLALIICICIKSNQYIPLAGSMQFDMHLSVSQYNSANLDFLKKIIYTNYNMTRKTGCLNISTSSRRLLYKLLRDQQKSFLS